MVQITVDTNADPLPELEEALHILQTAIARRKPVPGPKVESTPTPNISEEEASLDTPFLKITVKDVVQPDGDSELDPKMPTLNQLLSDDSLSEEEINKLFKETQRLEAENRPPQKERAASDGKTETTDAFIEIVEFDEEK